jgi:hypothetical protein
MVVERYLGARHATGRRTRHSAAQGSEFAVRDHRVGGWTGLNGAAQSDAFSEDVLIRPWLLVTNQLRVDPELYRGCRYR